MTRPPAARALRAGAPPPHARRPGGVYREYWIQARSAGWNIVPTGRDDWHGRKITGKTSFRAYLYQEMTAGFAEPKGGLNMPGPTLYAEVGDVLVVHFRNADTKLRQAVTMHPHGVRYNPEYDGAYMGKYTRAGGFVAPGEEFTYFWECIPDAVGAWPYHDHGPNHTLNTFRGLFGAIVINERGAKVPDVNYTLMLHQLDAADHRPQPRLPVHQRARLRGQHADAEGQGRPGRRHPRLRDGLQLPRLPHARAPLARHRRRTDRHHHGGTE